MKRMALALSALVLAPMVMASANPAAETEHVVEQGETLGGIANRARVPAVVIAEANGLSAPYRLRFGQKLVIPRQRSHTVKSGETGFAIALRYGVPFESIAVANRLAPPFDVRTGQRLIIPAIMAAPKASASASPLSPASASSSARATPPEPYFRQPHDGKVLLAYAVRPDGKGHDGVDFAAKTGDMVRASSSGTVVFAGAEPVRFGTMVIIDHGNGWRSAYGHLARLTVAKGDVVKGGERIGIAGNSGDAQRTELHFEIRKNGKPVDPAVKLAAKRAQ